MIINNKKSQAWGLDLMIASVIFSIAIVIFFFYALNNPEEGELNIDSLYYDGKIIGDSILSEGYPKDWNISNVVTIGILSDKKINETKLEMFFNLSDTQYLLTKSLFNTQYNYYFFLSENMTLSFGEVEGIGSRPLISQNLIKISRFVIYKNKPVTAYIYIWN
jgi:hypothetical protein